MVNKIESIIRVIMAIYVLFFCYLVLFTSNVYLNEFSHSIGLVSKYERKVITVADSEKFDKRLNEEMRKGRLTDDKVNNIKDRVETEAKTTTHGYKRNYLVLLVYLIAGLVALNRVEYIICLNYNKYLLKNRTKI